MIIRISKKSVIFKIKSPLSLSLSNQEITNLNPFPPLSHLNDGQRQKQVGKVGFFTNTRAATIDKIRKEVCGGIAIVQQAKPSGQSGFLHHVVNMPLLKRYMRERRHLWSTDTSPEVAYRCPTRVRHGHALDTCRTRWKELDTLGHFGHVGTYCGHAEDTQGTR